MPGRPGSAAWGCRGLAVLLLLCAATGWQPAAAAAQAAAAGGSAYIIPLQRRTGVVRSRASSGRTLLGAGKVQVGGSVHDGYFYARLPLGSPPQHFDVIVDTGSTMTYVPCYDCSHCGGNHINAPFNPSKSATAQWVSCSDAACARQPRIMSCSREPTLQHHTTSSSSQADITRAVQKAVQRHYPAAGSGQGAAAASAGSSSSDSSSGQCVYRISYAEASSSEGALVRDVFTFPDNATRVPVTLGCESGETGEIFRQRPDGILGLGNNAGTFHGELAAAGAIPHIFSLCYGYPHGGALLLGDPPVNTLPLGPATVPLSASGAAALNHPTPAPPAVMWTHLVQNTHNDYYTVKVTSFTLGGSNMAAADAGVFDRGHGTLLDSGTTYMYLPTPAYLAFFAAVQAAAAAAQLTPFRDHYGDLCWKSPKLAPDFANLHEFFPTGEVRFSGDARLQLPPIRYMFQYGRGSYCLGVFDNYRKGTLLGGVATRNVLVKHDLIHKRIGIANVDCNALGQQPAQQFNMPLTRRQQQPAAAGAAAAAGTHAPAAVAVEKGTRPVPAQPAKQEQPAKQPAKPAEQPRATEQAAGAGPATSSSSSTQVLSSQAPVPLPATGAAPANATVAAQAPAAAAPAVAGNASSGDKPQHPPAAAAAAAAVHASPSPKVYWGDHGSSILKASDLPQAGNGSSSSSGRSQRQKESEVVAGGLAALLLLLLLGGGTAAWYKRDALRRRWLRVSPERAGFSQVSAGDHDDDESRLMPRPSPSAAAAGGGFSSSNYSDAVNGQQRGYGADVAGRGSDHSSSSYFGGSGGKLDSGGRYIAMTAASNFASSPAAAAAGGAAAGAAADATAGRPSRPGSGSRHHAAAPLGLVTDLPEASSSAGGGAAADHPDAVKSSPGGRDQTSPPRLLDSAAAAAVAGVAAAAPAGSLHQHQHQPSVALFSAQFDLDDDEGDATQAATGASPAAAAAAAAGGERELLRFQSISLE